MTTFSEIMPAIRYARNVADAIWQDHGAGAYCGCPGCAREVGLPEAIERRVLPLLELAADQVECNVCRRTEIDGMDYESLAGDRARIGELADRAAELWDAERDATGEVVTAAVVGAG